MRRTTHPTATTARRATGVLAAVGVLAALLVGIAPAATATESADPVKHGYLKITDKQWYVGTPDNLLFIDQEHATADGFYYATSNLADDDINTRDFSWTYQPYGAWCDYSTRYVGMNKWLGRYTCLPDDQKMEALAPGYIEATKVCQQKNGADYWTAAKYNGAWGSCENWLVSPAYSGAATETALDMNCAPWEPQHLIDGLSACVTQSRYDWEGVPLPRPTSVLATASRYAKTSVAVNRATTRAAARSARRGWVTRRAVRTYRGVRFVGTGGAPVVATRRVARSASAGATGVGQATISRACTRETYTLAQQCAASLALRVARTTAAQRATANGSRVATATAARIATRRAAAAALNQARTAPVPLFQRRAAIRLAQSRAQADLNRKIAARFPGFQRRR